MVSIDFLQFLADVVYYDQEQQSLHLKHLSKRIDIVHTLGSSTATINGKVIDLPIPSALFPKVISDPHLPPLPCVPLRAFAEALGWEVHWNNETRAISLKNQVT